MIKGIVEPVTLKWPRKYEILGVGVSATTYDEAVELVIEASRQRQSALARDAKHPQTWRLGPMRSRKVPDPGPRTRVA